MKRVSTVFVFLLMAKTPALSDTGVNYRKDMAPFFNDNCVKCHSKDGVAPFSLTSYDNAKTFAELALSRVEANIMPPGIAISDYQTNAPSPISHENIELLRSWISKGKQEGPASDTRPLKKLQKQNDWDDELGQPDIVLEQSKVMHIGAEGPDIYRYIGYPYNFNEDTPIKAMQLLPDNRKVVHHALLGFAPKAFIDELSSKYNGREGLSNPDDSEVGFYYPSHSSGFHLPTPRTDGLPRSELVATYIPGSRAIKSPDDAHFIIPKGSTISVQYHFHRTGDPEDVRPKIGLWLDKTKDSKSKNLLEIILMHGDFVVIPKGSTDFRVTSRYKFQEDGSLVGIIPHAHKLAKWMKFKVIFPSGESNNLLHIPHWDFNWQSLYQYQNPIHLPAGTVVEASVSFDNSDANPANPNHPPKEVWFDETSDDEMFLPSLIVSTKVLHDPNGLTLKSFNASMDRARLVRRLGMMQFRYKYDQNGMIYDTTSNGADSGSAELESLKQEDLEDKAAREAK
jgi:hypothetical protein